MQVPIIYNFFWISSFWRFEFACSAERGNPHSDWVLTPGGDETSRETVQGGIVWCSRLVPWSRGLLPTFADR